ncbi:hypothetical protein DKX38_010487 [Salix brachista]|uniref:Uncharacterized protein n=1 Tax=Salix brachista TaxID=2182728 RepID=A0A5N5MGC8_9ROSI|nr:hypothetical protein DKX38_010487 [Salix brachista]
MEKEKESLRSNNNGSTSNTTTRSSAQRTTLDPNGQTTSSDFVLQWGNRKRLRCMKVQVKDVSTAPVHKTTVRVDRRAVSNDNTDTSDHQPRSTNNINSNSNNNNPTNHSNGYFNLRQRPAPPPPPPPQRILRVEMAILEYGLGDTSLVASTFKPPPGLTGAVMANIWAS